MLSSKKIWYNDSEIIKNYSEINLNRNHRLKGGIYGTKIQTYCVEN